MPVPLRIGVIGLGVGEAHLKGYQELDDCEVQSICDINTDRLNEIGITYDVEKRFAEYKSITEDPKIDVVSICSYDDAHAEQVISALDNGKHVMVEKPLALHKHEAEAIWKAFDRSGKLLTSNLVLRETPRFRSLKKSIEEGELGDIFYAEGDYLHNILWKITEGWRGQMGFYCTLYGGGIHLIDLLRWLLSAEVVEVQAMGTNMLTRNTGYKFDDTFVATMKFDNGALAKSTTTFGPQRPKFHSLNLYGTKKTFINNQPNAMVFHGTEQNDVSDYETPYCGGKKKSVLLPDFIAAIRQGRKPLVNEVDVFRVMDICFAAWESAKTRKTIEVDYII